MNKTQMIEVLKWARSNKVNNFHTLNGLADSPVFGERFKIKFTFSNDELHTAFASLVTQMYVNTSISKLQTTNDDFYRRGYDWAIQKLELENTKLHKALE